MARRQKPPGYEKWTWDEINSGQKMSKSDKRYRKLAVSLGATKKPNGQIDPPAFADNPMYYFALGGLLVLAFLVAIFSKN